MITLLIEIGDRNPPNWCHPTSATSLCWRALVYGRSTAAGRAERSRSTLRDPLFIFTGKNRRNRPIGGTAGRQKRYAAVLPVAAAANPEAPETRMSYPTHLIPTTVVGSYPQPDWLIDRAALEKHGVPRVHAHEIWRVPPDRLKEAQDDATVLAIGEMERIGIDIVSDGEMRRESYSNYFSLALEGIDSEHLGAVIGANRRATAVARVVGKIRRKGPVEIADSAFLVKHATRATKITLPGPFTMSQQVQNEFYKDEADLAMDYAAAVNAELRDLKATGVDVVQLDEPWVRAAPDKAAQYGVAAINRALAGTTGPTIVH